MCSTLVCTLVTLRRMLLRCRSITGTIATARVGIAHIHPTSTGWLEHSLDLIKNVAEVIDELEEVGFQAKLSTPGVALCAVRAMEKIDRLPFVLSPGFPLMAAR